jgi:hypothetical protein
VLYPERSTTSSTEHRPGTRNHLEAPIPTLLTRQVMGKPTQKRVPWPWHWTLFGHTAAAAETKPKPEPGKSLSHRTSPDETRAPGMWKTLSRKTLFHRTSPDETRATQSTVSDTAPAPVRMGPGKPLSVWTGPDETHAPNPVRKARSSMPHMQQPRNSMPDTQPRSSMPHVREPRSSMPHVREPRSSLPHMQSAGQPRPSVAAKKYMVRRCSLTLDDPISISHIPYR